MSMFYLKLPTDLFKQNGYSNVSILQKYDSCELRINLLCMDDRVIVKAVLKSLIELTYQSPSVTMVMSYLPKHELRFWRKLNLSRQLTIKCFDIKHVNEGIGSFFLRKRGRYAHK